MSEVNGPKISVNQVNYAGVQKQNPTPETVEEQAPKITDFSDIRDWDGRLPRYDRCPDLHRGRDPCSRPVPTRSAGRAS